MQDPSTAGPFVSASGADPRVQAAAPLMSAGVGRPALDRICTLASRLLDAPSAQVSLMGEVQVAAAGHGQSASSVGQVVNLEESLCSLTLGQPAMTAAIGDTRSDPRSAGFGNVTSGVVGHYLGVPLVVGGHHVGALCVYGPGTRDWSEADIDLLSALGESAVAELELATLESTYAADRQVWQAAVDAAGVGAWDWALDTGALRWDSRLLEIFGLDAETFGGTIEAFNACVHPDDLPEVTLALEQAIATCGEFMAEYRIRLPAGGERWIAAQGQALAGPDGSCNRVVGAAYDITVRRLAQLDLERLNQRATFLMEAAELVAETLDTDDALQRLAMLLVPDLCDWCIVSKVVGDPRQSAGTGWRRALADVAAVHADPVLTPLVQKYAAVRLSGLTERAPVVEALRTGETQVVPSPAAHHLMATLEDPDACALMNDLAPEHCVVVPLRARGRPVGQLSLFRGVGRGAFADSDLSLVEEMAARLGVIIDNVRLHSEQRDLATALQESLLADPPLIPGLDFAVRYVASAEVAQVGGDWYDAFELPDDCAMLVIGDVMGHDSVAAAAMGQIRGMLRGIAATSETGPSRLITRLDTATHVLGVETTATMALAHVERDSQRPDRRVLRWSNAGHPPPFVVRPARSGRPATVEALETGQPDLLLGLDPDVPRNEDSTHLEPGDVVLLYTDGLVERRERGVGEGIEQLSVLLAELAADPDGPSSADAWCAAVLRALVRGRTEDDVAMVVMRVTPDRAA